LLETMTRFLPLTFVFILVICGQASAGLFDPLKNLVTQVIRCPTEVIEKFAQGKPAEAFQAVTDTFGKVVHEATTIPQKLLSYATSGAECVPLVGRLISLEPSAVNDAVSDFSANGACSRFISQCNADFGSLLCPNVNGVRDGLRSVCGNTSEMRGIVARINSSSANSIQQFCSGLDSKNIAQTDDVLGRRVDAQVLKFLSFSGAGNEKVAVQVMMQASAQSREALELSKEQLSLLKTLAENQQNIIDRLLKLNERQLKDAFRSLSEAHALTAKALYVLSKKDSSETERLSIVKDIAERYATAAEDKVRIQRELLEKVSAERDASKARLEQYLRSVAVQITYSHACLGQLETVRADAAFCARFPNTERCRSPAKNPMCD
jgi:hypothetical protein